ncbi:hypothetical protein M406DRAFT_331351 [Cryphonectria parasitica EP155]|uniref:Uncharacterized protein n=1 Tax=Cryphonectria parasitica (strain ATCC 38755 / EP155) TaxID=660469 RepID=A0A9P4Y122_CRYP1|nr:uncharacterized protein M406DRAFT_331351 [Cryphonectria parasitica EP155]KAF3765037.1 hypothetical protein M406DRAFT_331351 [Cryphonectria parasitica EP155]
MDSPHSPRSSVTVEHGSPTAPPRSTPSPSQENEEAGDDQQTCELHKNNDQTDTESCGAPSSPEADEPSNEENSAADDENEEAPRPRRNFCVMPSLCAAWVDLGWLNEHDLWYRSIFRTLYQDPDGGFLYFLLSNDWRVWLKWDGWFVHVDENGRIPQWMFDEMHPAWRVRWEANRRAMGQSRSPIPSNESIEPGH